MTDNLVCCHTGTMDVLNYFAAGLTVLMGVVISVGGSHNMWYSISLLGRLAGLLSFMQVCKSRYKQACVTWLTLGISILTTNTSTHIPPSPEYIVHTTKILLLSDFIWMISKHMNTYWAQVWLLAGTACHVLAPCRNMTMSCKNTFKGMCPLSKKLVSTLTICLHTCMSVLMHVCWRRPYFQGMRINNMHAENIYLFWSLHAELYIMLIQATSLVSNFREA